MSFVFLVINNKAVVEYRVQILSEVKIQEVIFHFSNPHSKRTLLEFHKINEGFIHKD